MTRARAFGEKKKEQWGGAQSHLKKRKSRSANHKGRDGGLKKVIKGEDLMGKKEEGEEGR